MSLRLFLWSLLPAALLGCGNPSLDVAIKELGGEVPGVPASAFHRSGQPCIDCHGPYKGAKPEMALAGTVFAIPMIDEKSIPIPVANVKITVTDALGLVNGVESPPAPVPTKLTNCAGNFYFTTDELKLAFPYESKIECPEPGNDMAIRSTQTMVTRISREGSCNSCHEKLPDPPSSGLKTQSTPGIIVCDTDTAHTGMTVYPALTHDNCPQAVPASGGATSGSGL